MAVALKVPRNFAGKPCAAWEEPQPISCSRSSDNGQLSKAVSVCSSLRNTGLTIEGRIIIQFTPTVSAWSSRYSLVECDFLLYPLPRGLIVISSCIDLLSN